MRTFHLSDTAFAALAAGRPSTATLGELRKAQQSRHLLLLSEILHLGGLPLPYAKMPADPLAALHTAATLAALRSGADPPPDREIATRHLTATHDDLTLRLRLEDTDPLRARLGLTPSGRQTDAEATRWQSLLDEAWQILTTRHRPMAETMAEVLSVLIPIEPDPSSGGLSATSADAYGAVAISPPADGRAFAVGLLHETQHSLLNATRTLFDLVTSSHPTYSPWRDDPRPPFGVLHGAYAYQAVTRFWRTEAAHVRHLEAKATAHPQTDITAPSWTAATTHSLTETATHPQPDTTTTHPSTDTTIHSRTDAATHSPTAFSNHSTTAATSHPAVGAVSCPLNTDKSGLGGNIGGSQGGALANGIGSADAAQVAPPSATNSADAHAAPPTTTHPTHPAQAAPPTATNPTHPAQAAPPTPTNPTHPAQAAPPTPTNPTHPAQAPPPTATNSADAVQRGERRLAEFEFARWRAAVVATADALLQLDEAGTPGGGLTAAGRRFVQAIRDEVAPWLAETVDDEVARLAAGANAEHRARWRLRNLVVAPESVAALAAAWRRRQPPPPVTEAALRNDPGRLLERSERLRLVHRFLRDPGAAAGLPEGHEAYLRGDHVTAFTAYGKDWVGLAVVSPYRGLGERPELVKALYETLQGRVDLHKLARWLDG